MFTILVAKPSLGQGLKKPGKTGLRDSIRKLPQRFERPCPWLLEFNRVDQRPDCSSLFSFFVVLVAEDAFLVNDRHGRGGS